MTTVELKVTDAYPNDSGRGIARLDPDTLQQLELNQGSIVEIEGGDATAATVRRADRRDWNTNTVRIDEFTRQNADVGIGERATIHEADAERAEKLVLVPPEEASAQFGGDATGMVKRQILKRPVIERDVVPITSSTNHPFMRSPGQAIPLIATETDPEEIVVITEDTSVELEDASHPRQTKLAGATRSADAPDSPDDPSPPRVNRTTVPEGLRLDDVGATIEGGDVRGTDATRTDRRRVTIEGTIENVAETGYERVEVGATFFENDAGTVHLDRRTTETRDFEPGHTWKFVVSYRPRADRSPRSFDLAVRATAR
ncbi:hypothetical protein BRC77_03310 [Halobacteriales archaeon QH_8_64_26]|nr:MAG: hypothetical protein BRC77_03310 [Halobacteriales archaeon QH_8_64_26]